MSIHDDNWTQEFNTVPGPARADWGAATAVIVIVSVIAYCVYRA